MIRYGIIIPHICHPSIISQHPHLLPRNKTALSISSPQPGTVVDSPVRLDVAVKGPLLPRFVLESISANSRKWQICFADDEADDELCMPLLGGDSGASIPLLSLTRNRNHTIEAFIRERGVADAPRISRTRAHFFVGRRRGVCGPSSSGAEIVQRSDSSSDEHDAVWSILPPLPPAAVSLCGGGGEEGVAVTFPPQQPLLRQELESLPIHGEVRLPQHIWEQHRNEGFSTHQPALIHYVRATARPGAGDIWEFGGGTGSTPLLRQLAEQSQRQLITVEDSAGFIKVWSRRARSVIHYPSILPLRLLVVHSFI